MNSNFTFFSNDSGAAAGPISYVQDVFNDVSLPATNNTGLTSNASTNPLGDFFNDNDSPRFSVKTLFLKDLVLIQDRSLWINNRPTYRIVWNENAPFASGYVSGNAEFATDSLGNSFIKMVDVGDIFGVTAIARRAVFLVQPSVASPTTITVNVDAVGNATYNVGGISANELNDGRGYKAAAVLAESSNETIDLHDFRISSTTQGAVKVVGIQLYFENTSLNIQVGPGSTYVNKSKVTTSTGATLAVPSIGSTLGGRSIIYKTNASGYATASQPAAQISSIGVGANASATLNVTTGTGSSFPIGSIIAAYYGSTAYIGVVQAVSTDALTVAPAIYPSSGVSGPMYKLAFGGTNAVIGASLYDLAYSIGSTQFLGMTLGSYLDPNGNYLFQCGASHGVIGVTRLYGTSFLIPTNVNPLPYIASVTGASSFIKVDGFFSAAEIEVSGASTNGVGLYGGTFYINGIPTWSSIGTAVTGIIKFPVFTGAGPGWNSFQWGFGSSTGINISKINLYTNKNPIGVSYGIIGTLDTLQGFVDQNNNVVGATYQAWGNYRRYYGSQLHIRTAGSPTIDARQPEGTFYPISTTSEGFTLAFYGKNVALGGTFNSGTTVTIDGTGIASTSIWGRSYTALTEGFHTLQVSCAAGSTTLISSLDISRTYGEVINTQTPVSKAVTSAPQSNSIPTTNVVYQRQTTNVSGTGSTPINVTGASATITTSGKPVLIFVTNAINTGSVAHQANGSPGNIAVSILRDGVIISNAYVAGTSSTSLSITVSGCSIAYDLPSPGVHTYSLQIYSDNGASGISATDLAIVALELK